MKEQPKDKERNQNASHYISDYDRGIRTAVLFISEMLGVSDIVYKDLDNNCRDSISAWLLLARLCGQIKKKKGE